jgi:hypothetical protein
MKIEEEALKRKTFLRKNQRRPCYLHLVKLKNTIIMHKILKKIRNQKDYPTLTMPQLQKVQEILVDQ